MLYVVLNDGETYSFIHDCRVIDIPDEVVEDQSDVDFEEHLEAAFANDAGVKVQDLVEKYPDFPFCD